MSATEMQASDENVCEFVTAVVDGQLFGLPIARVQDVFAPTRLTEVPLAPPEIAGVLNLRGRIVTVIDMRRRLGLPKPADAHPQMAIGIESGGDIYGLLVDAVGEVMRISDSVRVANPVNLEPQLADISVGVYRLDTELLIVLDLERVLALGTAKQAA